MRIPFAAAVVAASSASSLFAQVSVVEPNSIVADPQMPAAYNFASDFAAEGEVVATATSLAGLPGSNGVALFEVATTGEWQLEQVLSGYASFGAAIDIYDGQVIVGAPSGVGPGSTVGAVVIFERSAITGSWDSKQTISPVGVLSTVFGGRLRVTGGSLAVMLSYTHTNPAPTYWRLYERDGTGTWQETGYPSPLDKFPVNLQVGEGASSIARDGDLLAIGGYVGLGGQQNGRVYIFERNAFGSWIQIDRIEHDDHVGFGGFGSSVEIVGERIFVSAPSSQFATPYPGGSIHVYDRGPSNDWSESAVILQPTSGTPTSFGGRIAVEGTSLFARRGSGVVEYVVSSPGAWTPIREFVTGQGLPYSSSNFDIDAARVFTGRAPQSNGQGGIAVPGAMLIHDLAPLSTPISSVSAALGGSQQLSLRMGNQWSGTPYFMLGSLSGTAPGTLVDLGFASATLPINFDAYTMLCLDGQAPIGGQLGLLNQFGAADAVLEIPANLDPAFVGITVSHAAVVANWFTPRLAVTNVVGAAIVP